MANVTDPLARALHGTDPQNLIEYITRQKIYDCMYWKEECFGLSAVDILEKAMKLKHVGGSFGGNMQPSQFLCLVLKMLQIQPDDEIIYALIENEDFKYVRVLGAFYLRLTGRPKDIYTYLEKNLSDYRKLRNRTVSNKWEIITVDEFIDSLLMDGRSTVCGVSLPRLPKRSQLVDAGYLEGSRVSTLGNLDKVSTEKMLLELAEEGNELALKVMKERGKKSSVSHSKSSLFEDEVSKNLTDGNMSGMSNHLEEGSVEYWAQKRVELGMKPLKIEEGEDRPKVKEKVKKSKTNKLFKDGSNKKSKIRKVDDNKQAEEGSVEYWNEQRAKLGLKPLNE